MSVDRPKISRDLTRLLDWYFDEESDPTLPTATGRLDAGKCGTCGARIGEAHKVGCTRFGKVNTGTVRHGDSAACSESADVRRRTAIAVALGRLRPAQRRAVELAWARKWAWIAWGNLAVNAGRWAATSRRYHDRNDVIRTKAAMIVETFFEQAREHPNRAARLLEEAVVSALEHERQRGEMRHVVFQAGRRRRVTLSRGYWADMRLTLRSPRCREAIDQLEDDLKKGRIW